MTQHRNTPHEAPGVDEEIRNAQLAEAVEEAVPPFNLPLCRRRDAPKFGFPRRSTGATFRKGSLEPETTSQTRTDHGEPQDHSA